MILVDLPARQTLYRAHTPKWASQALRVARVLPCKVADASWGRD